jgi:tRNA threonylcarbamoyladenosine biosynthesis protein TsaB
VRVGIATARALGLSRDLPVAGIGTLEGLGRALLQRAPTRAALAVLDARRGEVFAALYDGDGKRLWEPGVGSPQALAERIASLTESPLGGGSGTVRFRQELASAGVEIPDDADPVHRIAARHICILAAAGGGVGGEGAGPPAPIYLRPPDAERWRERDSFQTAE